MWLSGFLSYAYWHLLLSRGAEKERKEGRSPFTPRCGPSSVNHHHSWEDKESILALSESSMKWWACPKCKKANHPNIPKCYFCGRDRFNKDGWGDKVTYEPQKKMARIVKGDPETGDGHEPRLVWMAPEAVGKKHLCQSCFSKPTGWSAFLRFSGSSNVIICGTCAFILMSKMVRFYRRLREGREPDVLIPEFARFIKKEAA